MSYFTSSVTYVVEGLCQDFSYFSCLSLEVGPVCLPAGLFDRLHHFFVLHVPASIGMGIDSFEDFKSVIDAGVLVRFDVVLHCGAVLGDILRDVNCASRSLLAATGSSNHLVNLA